ncbi:NADH pyrophosphatase [Longimycelium tulufanense]|uniref:NAD(+) diphosphatase n=1 Tax=Longimycelium tulufanense TaxID=907463 RepID=A0A8J3CB82_9PSEU|nr:NAD(+) diphosphatase [Longimycelium tulufanense]GGM42076.1 NADH pyrophosphatase [Longimycelium tulufanense]
MNGARAGEPFQLAGAPALSRSTVARDEVLRDDTERLQREWPTGRLLRIDHHGRARMAGDHGELALTYSGTAEFGPEPVEHAVLLGEQDGTCYWAVRVESPDDDGGDWADLRIAGALLNDTDAGLMTSAVALLNWHDAAGFCAVCGTPTHREKAGWARQCPGCGREEYPRTDPAVICLVHDEEGVNGEHVLLARQPVWPPERYSILAGFVEAGESLEACVVREIAEEVGLTVHGVRYLASQPWPFPRSLMLGFTAVASRHAPLRLADGEIEDARWVHRDEVRAVLREGGRVPGVRVPGMSSIAGKIVAAWAQAG